MVCLTLTHARMAYDFRFTCSPVVYDLTHSFVRVVITHRGGIVVFISKRLLSSSYVVMVYSLYLVFQRTTVVIASSLSLAGLSM